MQEEKPLSAKRDIREKTKELWIRSMKAIGNTAANIANNTRYKVDEVTLQNRRREVINDLANKAYVLWLKGEKLPDQMFGMLNELKSLDEQLNDMRAEKYAASRKTVPVSAVSSGADESEEQTGNDNEDEETEDDEILPPADSEETSLVSDEINHLFDGTSSIDSLAEKVNTSLDQMSERIRNFTNNDSDAALTDRQEKETND